VACASHSGLVEPSYSTCRVHHMTGADIAVSVGRCLLGQRVTDENSCFLLGSRE
jgi:hypothetical protein